MKNKILIYYLSILLSVADIGGIVLCIYKLLMMMLNKQTNVNGFEASIVKTSIFMQYEIYIYAAILILCILLYFPLEKWRQKLRDEVEYDEFGVSKKYGNFSKLSADERRRIEQEKMIDAERILDSATMKQITHKGEKDPESAMKKLIGLSSVKKDMHEMAARMEYEKTVRKNKKGPVSSMHMCFMGPPGTGKTTCARIMTGFLYKYGYIKKNQCVEIDGNFLNGMSPGESSKKTQMLINKSIGGVLFIDEAYALLKGNGGSYGQEAIATIVKAMEDHRNDIVLILAGYDKEMRELVNSNPGIESRIKHYMWFGDYTIDNLKDIFTYMAGTEEFCVSGELMDRFGERMMYEMKLKNFGNARTVRNLLDKIIDKHATNVIDGVLTDADKYRLMECDMPEIPKKKHI